MHNAAIINSALVHSRVFNLNSRIMRLVHSHIMRIMRLICAASDLDENNHCKSENLGVWIHWRQVCVLDTEFLQQMWHCCHVRIWCRSGTQFTCFYKHKSTNTDAEMPPQAFVLLSVDSSSFFTLRGLKLLRLLKPLGQLVLFSDLETVFDTIKKAIAPMVRQHLY